jgi:cellulose biosynthesis protein BcsQ
MLAFTTYSEAGGVGKTTLAANLAKAEVRAGRDVLVIDLDPQDGSLSYLLDVGDQRDNSDVDTLVRHLVENPKGEFDDLVRMSEGVDVIPSHNQLEVLSKHLHRKQNEAADFGEQWDPNKQLLRVLKSAEVPSKYDTLIVDPAATADEKLYNAVHATRNLVIPFEPTGKGAKSVEGLEGLASGLRENLDINVTVLAAVPMGYKDTNDQRDMLADLEGRGFDVPVTIRERSSLLEGCWRQQCTAFRYVDEHRSRERDYELDTLAQFDELAAHLSKAVEVTA